MPKYRIIFALFVAYFIFAILLNSVGAVILQSIQSFGVSKSGASVLEGFKDLPIAIVSFLVASSLPRLGYKNSLIIAFICVGLACLVMPLLPSFLTTKLLFLTVGASFALTKISVYSTIGLVTDTPNEHVSLMNIVEGVFMLGVLFAYWIFSVFVDAENPASLSWLNVYWILAAMCFANVILLATTRFPVLSKTDSDTESTSLSKSFQAMIALIWKPAVLVFVISAFLYVLVEQGFGTWMPTFNNEVLHIPPAMSIQLTGIFAAALAIGRFSAGALTRKIDWFILLTICVVATAGLIMLVLPLAENVEVAENMTWANAPLAAYIFPLVGLFMAPIYPAISSVILSSLPRIHHAAMAGLIVVFSALGGTTGSLVTGQVFEHVGGTTAFYLMLVPLVGLLLSLFFLKRFTQSSP